MSVHLQYFSFKDFCCYYYYYFYQKEPQCNLLVGRGGGRIFLHLLFSLVSQLRLTCTGLLDNFISAL